MAHRRHPPLYNAHTGTQDRQYGESEHATAATAAIAALSPHPQHKRASHQQPHNTHIPCAEEPAAAPEAVEAAAPAALGGRGASGTGGTGTRSGISPGATQANKQAQSLGYDVSTCAHTHAHTPAHTAPSCTTLHCRQRRNHHCRLKQPTPLPLHKCSTTRNEGYITTNHKHGAPGCQPRPPPPSNTD